MPLTPVRQLKSARRAAVKAGSRRPEGKVVQPSARVPVGVCEVVRRELLDHVVVIGESHLQALHSELANLPTQWTGGHLGRGYVGGPDHRLPDSPPIHEGSLCGHPEARWPRWFDPALPSGWRPDLPPTHTVREVLNVARRLWGGKSRSNSSGTSINMVETAHRYWRIERLLTTMPSLRSSPRTRSVPQSRFSRVILAIRSRTSALSRGRPILAFDLHVQYSRQPWRCQRSTDSGLTITRFWRQPGQRRDSQTQRIRSSLGAVGRDWCAEGPEVDAEGRGSRV